MDLVIWLVVFAVIIAIIISLVYIMSFKNTQNNISNETYVKNLIYTYFNNSKNGNNISIDIISMNFSNGNWFIQLDYITNPHSICPNFGLYSMEYPKYNFVLTPEIIYTRNCSIYGSKLLSAAPIAITYATNYLNNIDISSFINSFGKNNITTNATFISSYAYENKSYENVWNVTYSYKFNYSKRITVYLSYNGSLIRLIK